MAGHRKRVSKRGKRSPDERSDIRVLFRCPAYREALSSPCEHNCARRATVSPPIKRPRPWRVAALIRCPEACPKANMSDKIAAGPSEIGPHKNGHGGTSCL